MIIKERHIFAGVLLGTLLLLAIAILLPGGQQDEGHHLPWQVELDLDGHPRVFGITLGKSRLAELEALIKEPVVISLFARDSGERVVEGFFDNMALGGIRAKMVVLLAIDEDELQALYERGARIATMGSGTRKVTLSSEDMERVRNAPVAAITYLPRSRLSPDLVTHRFGQPEERIVEEGGEVEHWLYPAWGLDIALHQKGGDVLQYVLPENFAALRDPLLSDGKRLNH
jgi:hypothetical protein